MEIPSNIFISNSQYSFHLLYRQIMFILRNTFPMGNRFSRIFSTFIFFQGACLRSSCKHAVQFNFCKGYYCWSPVRAGVGTFSGFELFY